MLLWALVVVTGSIMAFAGRVQATTLWAGRAIAPADAEELMPTGVQDAITPRWQTWVNYAYMGGMLAILIVGSAQRWYLGIVAVIVAVIVQSVVGAILPKRAASYLKWILVDLANREADYRKQNDHMRGDAAHDFADKVQKLLADSLEAARPVPTMAEAKATPFGQVTH